MHARDGVRRIGLGLGVAAGAIVAAALVNTPLAHADLYSLEPDGPGTVVSDTGFPDLFSYGQVTQEIAEFDVTTGQVATGVQAGSLDATEHIFTSPLGSIGFIDGADAIGGTGTYAGDVGDLGAYNLTFVSPSGVVDTFGTIPISDYDLSLLDGAAAAVPADDLGLSGLAADSLPGLDSLVPGLESLLPGLDSLLNLF